MQRIASSLVLLLSSLAGCYAAHDRADGAGPISPCRLELDRGACCASGCRWIGEVDGPGPAFRCVERELVRCGDAGVCARGTCTHVHSLCASIDRCGVCMAAEMDHQVCL